MPSTTTITSTDFTSFVANTKIKSAEVNNNFSLFRGHLLPVEADTSASSHQEHDLGSSDHQWRTVYAQNLSGAYAHGITSVSAAYSLTSSDAYIFCDASSAAFTVNFPTAVGRKGNILTVQKTDAGFNAVTIDGNGSETVADTLTTALHTRGETAKFISDNSNWKLIERVIPAVWTEFSMTITASSNPTRSTVPLYNKSYWRRDRDSVEIQHYYSQNTLTGATTGSGTYAYHIPAGMPAIDTAKIAGSIDGTLNVGPASANITGAGNLTGFVAVFTSTALLMLVGDEANAPNPISGAYCGFSNAQCIHSFRAKVPITGWNG